MNRYWLFVDGSVDTKSKIGYGAYLLLLEGKTPDGISLAPKTKRFEDTSSTKLEIQTLLWAIEDIDPLNKQITVYTDSQNIIGLLGRRSRLEKENYTNKKGQLLANNELYKSYFKLLDDHNIKTMKLSGHTKKSDKDKLDELFTIVDRASRKANREHRMNLN